MLSEPREPGISERRSQSRLPVSALTCVELGEANGGIVVNISEGGVALTAAMKLPSESLTRLRIQLPKSRQWIDVNGQMQWKSESRKKAGFRFVDLLESDRRRIEEWIFQESLPRGIEGQETAVLEATKPSSRELPPPSSKNLMPGLAAPGIGGERQPKKSIPSAEPVTAMPRIEKFIPKPLPPQRATLSNSQEHAEELISLSDQRLYERQRVRALSFMELGECNGGVILDISEGGVSVRAAVAITDENLPSMRFQLPPGKEWIETSGRVVQLDETKTRAGIEFVDLSLEASMKISEWIASEASRDASPSGPAAVYDKTARLLETLTVRGPEKAVPGSLPESMAGTETPEKIIPIPSKEPVPDSQKAPVLLSATIPIALTPATVSLRKPVPKPASSPRPASARTSPAAGRPSWGTLALSVGLAALLSFAGAWIVAERAARDQVLRMMGNAPAANAQPATATQPPPPVTASSVPALPVEIPPSPAKSDAPAAGSTVAKAPAPALTPASPRKDTPVLSAGKKTTSAPVPVSKSAPPQSRPVESPALKTAATALVRPPEPPPAQIPQSKPAPAKETIAASSNPVVTQAAVSPEVGVAAKQIPIPSVKPPENPEIIKGAVSVSFSPYPSIRIPPELKSQTSKLGTSLQIGQVLSRVDPVYPEDAERQRIEGTVKLHVIIGREGAVQSVQVVNGPPSLAPAATSALHQWRYKQTLFGGQPIEAEQDVTVVFRMTKLRP